MHSELRKPLWFNTERTHMLTKFLVTAHATLVEVALWVLFLVAAIVGGSMGALIPNQTGGNNGNVGLLLGVTLAFIISVVVFAPALILGEILAEVKRGNANAAVGRAAAAPQGQTSTPPSSSVTACSPWGSSSSSQSKRSSLASGHRSRHRRTRRARRLPRSRSQHLKASS